MPMSEEEKKKRDEERAARETAAQSELDEMDKAFTQPGLESPIDSMKEPPKEEEPSKEEPPKEEVQDTRTELGPDDLEKETVPPVEPSVEKPPVEEPPPDEYDFEFLNDLARKAMGQEVATKEKPVETPTAAPPAAPTTPTPPTPPTVQPPAIPVQPPNIAELCTIDQMNEAFESPEKFVSLLQQVATKIHSSATQLALQNLTSVIQPTIQQAAKMMALVDNFYKENPDLQRVADFVKMCAMQVEAKHPDWDYKQILDESAKVARARIPALQKARQAESRATSPSFAAQQSGGKRPAKKPELSTLEKELEEMPNSW